MTKPLEDQVHAAWDHARRLAVNAAEAVFPDRPPRPIATPSYLQDRAMWAAKAGRVCKHLTAPRPVAFPLWEDRLMCMDCFGRIKPVPKAQDWQCDGCQTVTPEKNFRSFQAQSGATIFLGGMCDDCYASLIEGGGSGSKPTQSGS